MLDSKPMYSNKCPSIDSPVGLTSARAFALLLRR